MGRPREVTDEEIIAAGRRLDAAGGVNATRLWKACNEHGRPARLLEVWNGYKQGQSGEPLAYAGAPALPIPETAQRLAAELKGELSTGIDRALASIYAAVEDAVQGRFRQELADLTSVREAHQGEIEEALAALGDMSEAQGNRDIRIKDLEAALASVLRERDVSEALRGAQAEQHDRFLARLHNAETNLQQERQTSLDLKIAQTRAEVERESLDRQCGSIRAKLEIARTAAEQHTLDLVSLRESDGRNLEAIRQRDLEIERLREAVARTEAASLALMERAVTAEQTMELTAMESEADLQAIKSSIGAVPMVAVAKSHNSKRPLRAKAPPAERETTHRADADETTHTPNAPVATGTAS